MRDIKFRAWSEYSNKLVVWEHMKVDDTLGSVLNGEDKKIHVMQYTGLKDKNGREIYEGDLYQYTVSHDMYDPNSGHITFETKHVKAVTFENGAFYHGIELLSDVLEYDDSLVCVGNIYENPELLEAQ
ncbi:YopX family protein [Solibacillus sp. FSL R7-0682]|uniref:YopX family protein n=1 Tax=Solibacillus sp. FSL R7-0682 TaxID=2921690 RepID=UPI0030F648F6